MVDSVVELVEVDEEILEVDVVVAVVVVLGIEVS